MLKKPENTICLQKIKISNIRRNTVHITSSTLYRVEIRKITKTIFTINFFKSYLFKVK
jgi:hypothetical protein